MSKLTVLSRIFVVVIFITVLGGCVFTPVVSHNQPYNRNCDMKTQKLKLSPAQQQQTLRCNHLSPKNAILSCIVLEGIILPAGSFIVSSSIVLINNTLHWIEYKGKCDKSPDIKATAQPNDTTN